MRRVCTGARDAFEVYQKDDLIGKFWERSIVAFLPNNLIEADQDGKHQFEFHCQARPEFKLSLSNNSHRNEFLKFLSALMEDIDSFTIAAQKAELLESLDVGVLNNETAVNVFKEILSIICRYPSIFPNLKCLEVEQLSNLTDFKIPSSIESFKSRRRNDDINICGQNFKLITLESVSAFAHDSFVMENLPELESLKIETMPCVLAIDLGEMPKLKHININGVDVRFDRFVNEEITIGRNRDYPGRPGWWWVGDTFPSRS